MLHQMAHETAENWIRRKLDHPPTQLSMLPNFQQISNSEWLNPKYVLVIYIYGSVSKPCTLVNIKIAGKWMFIPLKMVLIGIDS